MDPIAIVIVAAGWVLLGLVVGLWMVRHGHDPRWVAIAVALGPIFVPIALERVERLPRLAASSLGGLSERHDDSASRLPVLVVEPVPSTFISRPLTETSARARG